MRYSQRKPIRNCIPEKEMKDIYIFIVNFNRYHPCRELVESLLSRGYRNIVILDNASQYKPLLDWYNYRCGVKVHHIGSNQGPYIIDRLPDYKEITQNQHYVTTDADCVPIEETPADFLEHMVELSKEYNIGKVGMGLKIDDLPDHFQYKQEVINHESSFWNRTKLETKYGTLYRCPIDSTFAVSAPGVVHRLNDQDCRCSFPYLVRHIPWYYDMNDLPEDEKLLRQNKLNHIGHWSSK